jgi:hypothetical protein
MAMVKRGFVYFQLKPIEIFDPRETAFYHPPQYSTVNPEPTEVFMVDHERTDRGKLSLVKVTTKDREREFWVSPKNLYVTV